MTPDMLSITDSAYASLLLDQNIFQASEATLKVPDLSSLNTTITGSTDTLGIALTNLPNLIACNYLLSSIEPPLTPENNFIFLCYNWQFSSYTSSLITSLFPTLALLYPEVQKTEVWQAPSQHTCTFTISKLLTSSDTHLQLVMTFNLYSNASGHQIPSPDSDFPPSHHPLTKLHCKGKTYPPPRPQAPTSLQPHQNSWTEGPHIQPNSQPSILSITTSSFTNTTESQPLLGLQAEVAALALCLGPDNLPANQALLTAVTETLIQPLFHLPALIEQHINATLQSSSFSATVTTSIQTELLSFQPPSSCTAQESGSKSE